MGVLSNMLKEAGLSESVKILMIGENTSGKTTYMASAYGLLKGGRCDFSVNASEYSEDVVLFKIFSKVCAGGYPTATETRREYSFNLKYKNKQVLKFDWVDYYGGVIKESESKQLMSDIDGAEGIMVFVRAQDLLDFKFGNRQKIRNLQRVMRLITNKLIEADGDKLFSVLIVITMWDQVNEVANKETLCEPIKDFINMMMKKDYLYVRVVPVSCTGSGFMNVDLPLLDVLHSGIAFRFQMLTEVMKHICKKGSEYEEKAGFWDNLTSFFKGETSYAEMTEVMYSLAQEGYEMLEGMGPSLQDLSNYINSYMEPTWTNTGSCGASNNRRRRLYDNL